MSDYDYSVSSVGSRGYHFSDNEFNGRSNWIDKGERFGLRPDDFATYSDYINAVKSAETQTSTSAAASSKGDTVEFSTKKSTEDENKKEDAEAVKSDVNNIYQDVVVAQISPFANSDYEGENAQVIESQIKDLTQDINTLNSVTTLNSTIISKENEIKDAIDNISLEIKEYEENIFVVNSSAETHSDTQEDILADDTYLENAMNVFGAVEEENEEIEV